MNTKTLVPLKIIAFVMLYCASLQGQTTCPNRALHFNPVDSISSKDDYISLDSLPISGNHNFTVETWFLSDATSTCDSIPTSGEVKHLLSLGSTAIHPTHFFISECGGRLNIAWLDTVGVSFSEDFGPTNIRGVWHHLAVTRDKNQVRIYLDSLIVFDNNTLGYLNTTNFKLGAGIDTTTSKHYWEGKMDEIRVWNEVRTPKEIVDFKDCNLLGTEQGLQVYWPLNQGVPEADNSTIETVTNSSITGNKYDGQLHGFSRTGSTSNFVCTDYNSIDLVINTIPFTGNTIRQFCAGDFGHFCLDLPKENTNSVSWQYKEEANWIDVNPDIFSFSCGPIQLDNPMIAINCANNTKGYVNREIRAFGTIIDSLGKVCDFISEVAAISICCPINEGRVVVSPSTLLCEGDSTLFSVDYIPNPNDLFLNQPIGDSINIEWYFNGKNLEQHHNKFSFSLDTVIEQEELCFSAKISNCSNKSHTISTCFEVPPKPIAGTISATPAPTTRRLTQINDKPKEYTICPRDEATLIMNDQFVNCVGTWEYSYDTINWTKIGSSNTRQNTNQLPSNWPPNINCIYYRVTCEPPANSSCVGVVSNTIKICIQEVPTSTGIIGDFRICHGSSTNLALAEYDARNAYIWFHNGKAVGSGETYMATKSGCYTVKYTDGCYIVSTPIFDFNVCEIQASISCPMTPNDCACLGDPIVLSACESIDTCNGDLVFNWTWDSGTLVQQDGCFLEHIPDADGTTYTLTITNTLTGCKESNTRFLKPCDKQ